MKRALTLIGLLVVAATSKIQAGVLWAQDFSAGGDFNSYVGSGANQFDAAGNYSSFNTSNFNLQLTSPTSAFAATYGLDFGNSAGYFQFDFNLASSINTGQILPFGVGSYSGTVSNWLSSAVQVLNSSTLSWNIRDTFYGVNSNQTFTGPQRITFVINNSGGSFDYDLGSGISGMLTDNTYRVYVGSQLLTFGSPAVDTRPAANPNIDIEGFRLTGGNPAGGVVTLDNIIFATTPVPEPSTYALLMAGLAFAISMVRRQPKEITSL